MTAQDRRSVVATLAQSALAAAAFCFLYVYVELRLNARWQGHVYRWSDLLFVFRYHLPLFLVLGWIGAVVALALGRASRTAPSPAAWGGLLFACWLVGNAATSFLVAGPGLAAIAAALAGYALAISLAAAAALGIGLVQRKFARALWLPWAIGSAAVVVGVALLRFSGRSERGFFDPLALLALAGAGILGFALFLLLGRLCRRPVLFLAVVIVIPVLASFTWLDTSRAVRVERTADAGRPNVILILIDTLRAKSMSVYGYPEDTTPRLRELVSHGVRFENCIASSNWTKPSTTSLLTSLEPSVHGVVEDASRVPDDLLTAGEVFQAAGYTTIGLVANHQVRSIFGFDQGFDVFRDPQSTGMSRLTIVGGSIFGHSLDVVDGWLPADRSHHVGVRAEDLRADAIRRIRSIEEPFFLYLHFVDPHAPYDPPDDYERVFNPDLSQTYTYDDLARDPASVPESGMREMERRYLGEIFYTDAMLGELFDQLAGLGLERPLTVAVTADHGEAFGDHDDYGHGHSLYEEQIRIPLLLWGPGVPPAETWTEPVALVDVLPTLVELAGLEIPAAFRGRSLVAGLAAGASRQREFVLSEKVGQYAALRGAGWKYIENEPETSRKLKTQDIAHRDPREYYDLVHDPEEAVNGIEHDEAASRPGQLAQLRELLGRFAVDRDTVEMDEETRRQLEALGYL